MPLGCNRCIDYSSLGQVSISGSLLNVVICEQEEAVELRSGELWQVPECTSTSMDVTFEMHPGTATTTGTASTVPSTALDHFNVTSLQPSLNVAAHCDSILYPDCEPPGLAVLGAAGRGGRGAPGSSTIEKTTSASVH